MKRHLLLLAAVLGAASFAQASTVLFDDAMQNGASFWHEGQATSDFAPAGEPAVGAGPNIKLNMPAWQQAGVGIGHIVSAPEGFIEAQIYRVGSGDLHLRHGGAWLDVPLNAANSDKWTIDAQPGNYSFTSNAWHTLRVDVVGLGITDSVNTIGVKAGGGTSVWYMDNVSLVPEPTAVAAASLGSLALLRRRRRRA